MGEDLFPVIAVWASVKQEKCHDPPVGLHMLVCPEGGVPAQDRLPGFLRNALREGNERSPLTFGCPVTTVPQGTRRSRSLGDDRGLSGSPLARRCLPGRRGPCSRC